MSRDNRATSGKETSCGSIWRYPSSATKPCNPYRYACLYQEKTSTQRVTQTTLSEQMRIVSVPQSGGSASHPQAGRPQETRTGRKATMDTSDGGPATKDADCLS